MSQIAPPVTPTPPPFIPVNAVYDHAVPFAVAALAAPRTRIAPVVQDGGKSVPTAPLLVRRQPYPFINLADVRPGDIGFEYKRDGKSLRQLGISLGERLGHYGSPNVLHAFLVVDVFPNEGKLLVADGAVDYGINLIEADFDPVRYDGIDPDAEYLFLRVNDPRLATCMAQIGRNWARPETDNFSMRDALCSPFKRRGLTPSSATQLCALVDQAGAPMPVLTADGRQFHRMMCSDFVTTVGAAATVMLYKYDTGRSGPTTLQDLDGLSAGPAGQIFACNPKATPPAALHRRLTTDPAACIVGHIPPRNTGIRV